MNLYLILKLIHIISAAVIFGTGLGIAFFMLRAYLSQDTQALRVTARNVVLADRVFTTPAVVTQLISGLWLMHLLSFPFRSLWFVLVMVLFIFVGACWLPVLRIQVRIRDAVENGATATDIAPWMRIWTLLGIAAFCAVLVIFFLMVFKVGQTIPVIR